jgi:hypothetical protein
VIDWPGTCALKSVYRKKGMMRQTLAAAVVAPEPASLGEDDLLSQGANSFRKGDQVVLTGGPYWGTPGIFLRLRSDVSWADLEERNGSVRCHPVKWISPSSVAKIPVSVGSVKTNPFLNKSVSAWEDDGGALRPDV